MNEERKFNPWEEKMKQVSLPDEDHSWRQMKTLLDKEMPMGKRRNWMFSIILLLLLVGVCNCPGVWKLNSSSETESTIQSKNKSGVNIPEPNRSKQGNNVSKKSLIPDETKNKNTIKESYIKTADSLALSIITSKQTQNKTTETQSRSARFKRTNFNSTQRSSNKILRQQGTVRASINDRTNKTKSPGAKEPSSTYTTTKGKDTAQNIWKTDSTKTSNKSGTDSLNTSPKQSPKDSAAPAPTKFKKVFAVSIGLNHFVAIASQHKSNYNSSGTTGQLRDYLPVPQLRYFLSERIYVQVEAQVNTPQYTSKLLASQVLGDTNIFGQRKQQSLFITKLFYYNIPVSIHIIPVNNLAIGAGIQYSRLTNGIGLFEEKQVLASRPDSFKTTSVSTIKSDPIFNKLTTREVRLLADINYNWKQLSVGMRYNHALSNFINIRISNTEVTQARNKSLQLYFRYTLWDQRKNKYQTDGS